MGVDFVWRVTKNAACRIRGDDCVWRKKSAQVPFFPNGKDAECRRVIFVKWKWLAVPLPALLGMGGAVLATSGQVDNQILYLRADVGTLSLLGGFFLSTLASACLLFIELQARASHVQIAMSVRPWIPNHWNRACTEWAVAP